MQEVLGSLEEPARLQRTDFFAAQNSPPSCLTATEGGEESTVSSC